ncbi:unnamed protein product [Fraxinus pennsylvanica]|uniref:AD domain-containing protein n=1 Tax=Fraxinus pennsylvanica TaxID=56036 RepID=A0AAD1ZW01_9LAMI|nr:unnamed protein product [Fraxinus pennsylvanica]
MDWPLRQKVGLGIAKRLAYLHSSSAVGIPIVHREFKSTNILLDSSYEAKIFDNLSKIQEGVKSGSGPKRNIRLLKANYVKEFTFLGQGEDPLDISKCFLDLNTLQAREDSAIRQAEIDAERIGVGVSAEAQSIFDALAKTKIQEGVKSGSGPKRNIRLLKANYVKEFTFLGQGEDPLDISKCFLDLNTLQAREDSAIRQAEIDAERIGVGVSAEAQSIFDALAKTLPVRWDKTNIVVMNEVRVSSPYLPENVTGGTPAANERVRKVLEFEKKRLQARSAGQ